MEDQQEASGFGLSGLHPAALNYKLVALDVDGTLVSVRGEVHPADREAIAAIMAQGIVATVITGRLFSGTRHVAREIGTLGAIGCVDGCHLVDVASSTDLHHGGIVGRQADELREVLSRFCTAAFVFARDSIVYDERSARLLSYMQTWSSDLILTTDVTQHEQWHAPHGITAVVCIGARAQIERAQAEIVSRLGTTVTFANFPVRGPDGSSEWGMVVRTSGYSKGTALSWLARHYGVRIEETIAIGDWYNDVTMFEVAGRSFAMGQAPEAVKQAATDCLVADVWTGGGIAEALRRAGLL